MQRRLFTKSISRPIEFSRLSTCVTASEGIFSLLETFLSAETIILYKWFELKTKSNVGEDA